MIGGRVLDLTAIRDVSTGGTIYGRALLGFAVTAGVPLVLPAAALLEAWSAADEAEYPFLADLLGLSVTVVEALDAEAAELAGGLSRNAYAAGRWSAAAAHTVLVAQRRGLPVVTHEPGPLRELDQALDVELLA